MKKECVVTGATGHIGQALCRKLVKEGCQVTALVLPQDDVSMLPPHLNIVRGDLLNLSDLYHVIPSHGIVFHLAGMIEIGTANRHKLYEVNVQGTKNLVDVCMIKHVERFVYTSSVHVIDPLSSLILREPEIETLNHETIVGDYAKSKTIAVQYVNQKIKEGLPGIICYPSGVIGPYDYKLSNIGQMIVELLNQKIPMQVNGCYNFVDVRDCADGIYRALEYGRIGEGYILSGDLVTIKNMFAIVRLAINKKRTLPTVPIWLAKMFVGPFAHYYRKRKKVPVFTAYSLYTVRQNAHFSHDKATNELGYNPRSSLIALADAVDWIIENKPELLTGRKAVSLRKTKGAF